MWKASTLKLYFKGMKEHIEHSIFFFHLENIITYLCCHRIKINTHTNNLPAPEISQWTIAENIKY